jgi:hypothetical protein
MAHDVLAVSIEVFLSAGGVCLSAPRDCGLEYADSICVDVKSRSLVALSGGSALPIEMPQLSEAHCQALVAAKEVAIGEFTVRGVVAAYSLAVVPAA